MTSARFPPGLGAVSSNLFRDAADVLHVLLAVLSEHATLADRGLYLVAES